MAAKQAIHAAFRDRAQAENASTSQHFGDGLAERGHDAPGRDAWQKRHAIGVLAGYQPCSRPFLLSQVKPSTKCQC